jgi:hypothetical protein
MPVPSTNPEPGPTGVTTTHRATPKEVTRAIQQALGGESLFRVVGRLGLCQTTAGRQTATRRAYEF